MKGFICIVPIALVASGCLSDPCQSHQCDDRISVAHQVDFALADEDGLSVGFDLDGRVSEERDAATCGHGDYQHPSGTPGIDNNGSVLFESAMDVAEASAEEIIRSAINEGRLLVMTRLIGVDDAQNDDCVDVEVFQGTGAPYVGTDGFILSGQTFGIDEERARMHIECARLRDGVLTTPSFNGKLFVSIFGVHATLTLSHARIEGTVDSTGLRSALLGAAIETSEMHDVLEQTNDPNLQGIGHYLVDSLADMGKKNGRCTQMSATIRLNLSEAYLF